MLPLPTEWPECDLIDGCWAQRGRDDSDGGGGIDNDGGGTDDGGGGTDDGGGGTDDGGGETDDGCSIDDGGGGADDASGNEKVVADRNGKVDA